MPVFRQRFARQNQDIVAGSSGEIFSVRAARQDHLQTGEKAVAAYLFSGKPRPLVRRGKNLGSGTCVPAGRAAISSGILSACWPAPCWTFRSGFCELAGQPEVTAGGRLLFPVDFGRRSRRGSERATRGGLSSESVSMSGCSSKKSETYRNVSRSRPRSTNADCMPGSTRE